MADFVVVDGEIVPIDSAGNPLPIANGAALGSTPGLVAAAKDGSNASFLEVSTVSGAKALKVDVVQSVSAGSSNTSQASGYNWTLFGQSRTVTPHTLADLNFKYEINSREWGTATATGGTVTYNSTLGIARLAVTGANGSRARLRTHTYFRYQSGKMQTVKITHYCADAGQANQTRRWGAFDDNDGFFFELAGTDLSLVRRSSVSGAPVDSPVARASWSGDKLNGSGPSGITLDVTKSNIYEIHYTWLGAGPVEFFIDGILVHRMDLRNTLASPTLRTGQLPVQWEVVNTGASTASSLDAICAAVSSEGGSDPPLITFSAFNSVDKVVGTTEIPVLSIRPKALYPSGGITNRMLILPFLLTIRTEGARLGYRIVMNPATLTGPSWTSVDTASGTEFDVSATAFTGGQTLVLDFLPNINDKHEIFLENMFTVLGRHLRQDAFATGVDTLTLTAVVEAAGVTNVRMNLSSYEVR